MDSPLRTLPDSIFGSTTTTIGLFETKASRAADWLADALGSAWRVEQLTSSSIRNLLAELNAADSPPGDRYVLLDIGGPWTVLLTDGPLGTDPGVLPSYAARQLGVRGVRATAVEPQADVYGAAVLEVYTPEADDNPLHSARSVYAVDDGGSWEFGQTGTPLPFEDVESYQRRRIRDRLTPDMVRRYIADLGVPPLDLESAPHGRSVLRS